MCKGGKRAGLLAVGLGSHCVAALFPNPVQTPCRPRPPIPSFSGCLTRRKRPNFKGPRSGAEILGISRAAIQRRGARLLIGRREGKDSRNFEQTEPRGAGEQTRAEPRTAAQWMAGVLPSARCARAHRYRGTRPLEPGTRSEEHTSELQSPMYLV